MALTLTKRLKKHAVKKGWVAADAADSEFEKAIGDKITKGEITDKKLAKLQKAKEADPGKLLRKLLREELKSLVPATPPTQAGAGTPPASTPPATPPVQDPAKTAPTPLTPEQVNELVEKRLKEREEEIKKNAVSSNGPVSLLVRAHSVLGLQDGTRVKGAIEEFSHNRKDAIIPPKTYLGTPRMEAGQPAMHGDVPLYHPSDRDKAVISAYFKWVLACSSHPQDIPRGLHLTDKDRDIVQWAMHNCQWSGLIKTSQEGFEGEIKVQRRKLADFEVKAMLDDSTSGGIEIAPIEFDDAIVLIPVLYGELYPLVNVVNLTRGRRVKGGSMANPVFTSGVAEGTAIQVFNTSGFVNAFDTPVYTAVGAMEVGLDFEEDSPTNIGQLIVQKYGEKAMEWLDRVIAVGDGVTEPQGVLTSTAVTLNNSDNPTTGSATIGDYEGLLFGVAKAFRNTKGSRNVFFGNETSYRRARAIPIGPGDERRVFGMTHSDFMLFGYPYKIQINIPNQQIGFFNAGYYRMYRRLGLNIRIETAGNYLATKNLRLIVVRMRYGGQIELGGAACVLKDSQT